MQQISSYSRSNNLCDTSPRSVAHTPVASSIDIGQRTQVGHSTTHSDNRKTTRHKAAVYKCSFMMEKTDTDQASHGHLSQRRCILCSITQKRHEKKKNPDEERDRPQSTPNRPVPAIRQSRPVQIATGTSSIHVLTEIRGQFCRGRRHARVAAGVLEQGPVVQPPAPSAIMVPLAHATRTRLDVIPLADPFDVPRGPAQLARLNAVAVTVPAATRSLPDP
eukprot:TRINITY_DN8893_c0_g1_i2.p1 TRINITY_DN8893_c0_g1~~TRINITY_DN8893_c0_g1_i2.p1  ORF type:complete len:220 (-),score=4.22 TRINITY_DN8893_c0_g1_i2:46-705(-)